MVKYILYIDFMSGINPVGYKYIPLESDNLVSAIDEADKVFDGNKHYLVRIMEKSGRSTASADGYRIIPFTAVLCRRSYGWHRNTADNYECTHTINYHYNRGTWWTEDTSFTSWGK